ncbi:MAG: hypothetical protein JWO82_2074, partial [Akkermansiaceae bacterium]|nr:hypothetical protein [Akkermansiaceae bacterium]
EKDARLLVILIPSTDLRLGEIATKTVPENKAYVAAEREIENHRNGNNGANPAPPQPH